jgi:hypothetical protein
MAVGIPQRRWSDEDYKTASRLGGDIVRQKPRQISMRPFVSLELVGEVASHWFVAHLLLLW